jgi:hypothetical protein
MAKATKRISVSYNQDVPTEIADQMSLTNPLALSRLVSMLLLHGMARAEPERFENLENAGFKVIRYGDIIYQVFDRFGGHYMDVGASAKIGKGLVCLLWTGRILWRLRTWYTNIAYVAYPRWYINADSFGVQIKVKSDALPLQYTENGIKFTDGTELKADFVVFATGFVGSMKVVIHDLLGSDVAELIEDFWGVNEEGEIKGAFKPSGRKYSLSSRDPKT